MVSKRSEPRRKDRARSEQDKDLRRQAILDTALELWREAPFEAISMSAVAERAGLAKGTLYLYFQTKQELFLALLSDLMAPWFAAVEAALEGVSPRQVAPTLVRSLEGHHDMVRLLSILSGVLEAGSPQQAVLAFKSRLAGQSARIGVLFEQRLNLLPGLGMRLLLHFNALTIGLYQMSRPVEGVSDQPEFAPLSVEFALELEVALSHLIAGLTRPPA